MKPIAAPVANPEDGEVALEVLGPNGHVTETLVLRMKTNAVCRLEKVMGEHVHKLGPRLTDPGMQDLRALLCAALEDRQPDMTLADVGDLIDRAGWGPCLTAVLEAFRLGFPKGRPGADVETTQGKGRGTGPRSSPTRRKPGSAPSSSGASHPGA